MKKVKLLLSGKNNMQFYAAAVEAAGGEAVYQYLPPISTDYDGLILCGGSDMDPKYYGQEINGSVEIDDQRDTVEMELTKAFVEAAKPILGICRGHQLLNVYFGGTLCQDLEERQFHTNGESYQTTHPVTAAEGSVLHGMYGSTFTVNSYHHQAVEQLGQGLVATAWWNGTLVEAFHHCEKPVFGVQWHPEQMCAGQLRPDTVDGIHIFRWFLQKCRDRM